MNLFYVIFFAIFMIRIILYFFKNNVNPNRNNIIVKEYKLSQKSQKLEEVEKLEKLEKGNKFEEEELKEFAKHHFQELKKINPLISLNDDFPEALFPKAFKKLLITDKPTDKDYIEAIESINKNFTRPIGEEYKKERISVVGNDIYINNDIQLRNLDFEIQPIFKLEKEIPEIRIFEDCALIKTFILEPRDSNANLYGKYFHSEIKINSNSSIQMQGYISKSQKNIETNDEGIRFQPFFLSDREEMNKEMRGKGMFARGLYYSGIEIIGDIRLICICDDCQKSFSVEFNQTNFSEEQYFYSSNSKETLIVPYSNNREKVHFMLRNEIDEIELKELENKLPRTEDGKFEYYNSFKCPHCFSDYINYKENKELRPYEYNANYYINHKPRYI